ncbi:DNA double-strand break repair nuclease NurA [Halocalculus aciditolerans]|uniref:Nuclease n=1 Tax=Halocalculus aciditolerans TaxID=1383812 RepID=A0A830F0N2_9EURY|nr:DNA double-strand break repair nuclease NurA [Halocalculus aciditolerans]GGL49775.1 nuclease [Halocalculus aciditolerans]
MTLDPVHFDGISGLVSRISHDIDEAEHRSEAMRAWESFLDPLVVDGDRVLEPLDDLARYAVDVETAGVQDAAFDAVHGLDSGTVNPRAFKNGIVLDVAQAALAVHPSDVDTHRARTVIATVHTNDDSVRLQSDDWQRRDEGYWRGRIFRAPNVERDEEAVVHALSLYLAESTHALDHASEVSDLLVLDGPLYPKIVMNWLSDRRELAALLEKDLVRDVVRNYLELVEVFAERDVPLCGFVKTLGSRGVVSTLREKTHAPWTDDAAFFTQVLERRDADGDRVTDDLTYTNWFVSRVGIDYEFSDLGDALGLDLDLDREAYEVAFFVVYDPRTDTAFKVELPRVFADDPDVRERVTRQVVSDVAATAGPPLAVKKADELARIGAAEKNELVSAMETALDSEYRRPHNEDRWG